MRSKPTPPALRRAAAAAALLLGCSVLASPPRRRVIIDQDAYGGVNLQPILMVVQAQDVEVVGVTIESGDGWQKESTAHALRMLELVGRTDIPVVSGATFPLLNSEEETRRWEGLYGRLPYKGAWTDAWPDYNTANRRHYHAPDVVPPLDEGSPTTRPLAEPAASFLARKVREAPGEVSILALGPFTNIALAAELDEGFAANAKELVLMAGSFNPDASARDEFSLQFVNSPRVEFNCRWDPEAARITLHAHWRKITVVPTDATVGTKMTAALAREAGGADTPASRYFARFGAPGFPMWDETAAAVWLDPSIVRRSDQLAVDVDIDHGAGYGATLSWLPGFGPGLGEPIVTVVRAIDIPRLERMFVDSMRRPAPAP
ncbi:MAG: nucleoside hydrolase [Opitutaceae bacterium]|jgi:inosine-uridine nucleoside N-ribohydrolase